MGSIPKRSRRSSTTAIPATPASALEARNPATLDFIGSTEAADRLLAQVLAQHLGSHLSQIDILSCRLVCKEWRKSLPAERKTVDILRFRVDADGNAPALASIPHIFPAADTLSLHVSERISPTVLLSATAVLGTNAYYGRIKHLLLASTSPRGSRSSAWFGMPYWPVNLEGMQGLESLTFTGRSPDANLLQTVAGTCTSLTSLVLGMGPEEPLALTSSEHSSRLVTRPAGIQAITKLRSLRRLVLAVEDSPWDWDVDGGANAQLEALSALTGLTELRLSGAAVSAESTRTLLRAAQQIRRVALIFGRHSGRLHERRELALWKPLQHVELQLHHRFLESEIPLLTLGLTDNLRSLHLRSCSVSPYSLTALSSLAALTELSFDTWQAVGLPAAAADEGAAAAAVHTALVELLSGPLGERLEVLRMDLSDPSKDIYGDMPRLTETWAQGSLRVLHLVNNNAYSLSSTGALANLAGLSGLRDLRVSVQGQACRDDSALKVAWLPPNLTCLELVGVHLPCGQRELMKPPQLPLQLVQAQPEIDGYLKWQDVTPLGQKSRGSVQWQREGEPAAAAAAAPLDCASPCGSAGGECCGHARLRHLQRLSLHSCRFGCCSHLKEALGPALMAQLVSLELNDISGLLEEHLTGLGQLTGLTNLSVCALEHPSITSSSMVHVSGLVGLRRLRWHAGDSLDAPPHPAMLQPLRQLAVLDISSGQWWRMSRWHVISGMAEVLPMCEVAVS